MLRGGPRRRPGTWALTTVFAPRRAHSSGELLADGIVHALGLAAGVVGVAVLLALAMDADLPRLAALGVYSVALLAMLAASAAYNLFYGSRFREVLRGCDHCAILLLIAGTYTPFTTHLFEPERAAWLTGAIWAGCLGGMALRLTAPRWFDRLSVGLYLGLGWFALVTLPPLVASLPGLALTMLVGGGLLYSVGVVFHLWERLRFHNAVWHGFVLAAAVCHWVAVLQGVALAR